MKQLAEMIIYRKAPSANVINGWRYKRWYWRIREEKAAWKVLLYSAGSMISKATEKRRVEITLIRKRRIDPDNNSGSVKFLLDMMVSLGWLVDDGVKWIDLQVEQRNLRKNEPEGAEIKIYAL